MKRSSTSLFVLLVLLALCSFTLAADTCPTGMRKLYLDEESALPYGVARNEIPAVTFYEGNGALWYNRRVLVEPRFEVHLKANIGPVDVIEDTDEQILEGFTIVLSSQNNKVGSGTGEYIGYSGFTKSFIAEFDFNKNTNDVDSSSYSFKYCDSACTNDDSKAIYKGKLTNQRFDATKTMNWDFRLIYADDALKVYSGPSEVLYEYKVDLADKLGTTIPYVGFTGYQRGNRRELSLLGTFICEDNFDISKLKGQFVVNNEKVDTASYKSGQQVKYSFSFINNKGQVVPHCFKTNVWSYSFSLSIDCKSSYEISKVDEYYLLMTFNACSEIGDHTIGLKEDSHGSGPTSYYKTVPDGLSKITLIGHDGQTIDLSSWVSDYDWNYGGKVLKYGDINGYFSYKEGLKFVLDFTMTDQYGNSIDLGSTSDEMLATSGMKLVNSQNAQYSLQKYGDHYQFVITVTAVGRYTIYKNSYMSDTYVIVVGSADVDSSRSYCDFVGLSYPYSVKPDTKITYACYFYDSFGNKISYSDFQSSSDYEFSCGVKKTSPNTADYTSTFTVDGDHVVCTYTVSEVGGYKFTGYFNKKKSTTKSEITSKDFTASSSSYYLEGAKIFNFAKWQFVDIDGGSIDYYNHWAYCVTYIDLTDSTGTIYASSLGNLPSDFDCSQITAYITSSHDETYKIPLYVRIYENDGKYVGLYLTEKNTYGYKMEDFIKKNSFDYKIVIEMGGVKKEITYNYKFDSNSIGSYTTCFHDLDLSKTKTDFETIEVGKGGETYVGTITLQTSDGNLYNYDIGKDNIKLNLKDSSVDSGFSYRIVPDSVNGVYKVYVTATKEFNTDITININGNNVHTYSGKSTALTDSCYVQLVDSSLFDYNGKSGSSTYKYTYTGPLTSEGSLKIYFRLYDRFGNQISAQDFYKTNTDVSCSAFSSTDTSKYKKITYDQATDSFVFEDNISGSTGVYDWSFTTNDAACNNKTTITYDKSTAGAEVSVDNSYGKLVNNDIKTGEYAYVDVTLNNFNGENIGQVDGALEKNYGKVQVIAYYNNNKSSEYFTYDTITGGQTIRFKKQITTPENYTIVVKYNGKEIKVDNSGLVVNSRDIDFNKSELKMITSQTVTMDQNTEVTIDNTNTIPSFRYYLISSDGVAVTNNDNYKNVKVTAQLSDTNGNTWDLKTSYKKSSSGDYINMQFDDTTKSNFNSFRKDHYTLTITKDGVTKTYQIYLLGNGDDEASNAKEYDNTKTQYSTLKIEGEAGVTYTINIEFRDKDSLRWGYVIDTSKLTYSNSLNLGGDKLTVYFQKGSKNGQFIVNVMQKTSTEGGANNELTISYNGKELNNKIALSIKSSKLSQLVFDSGCKDGDVEDLPVCKFIPEDKYGNVVYSLFTSTDSNLQSTLNSYTVGKSTDGFTLTTNNYLCEGKYLCVQYGSTLPTTVEVTSNYFWNTYSYKIATGPIDADHSYAQLLTSGAKTAGGTYIVVIYPLDKYENELANIDNEYLKKFEVYFDVDREGKYEITSTCKLVEGSSNSFDVEVEGGSSSSSEAKVYNQIKCETPITTAGRVEFHVEFSSDEITCRSCIVSVIANNLDFTKTKTVYVNKNTEMQTDKKNEVETTSTPTWKVYFRDQYSNVITDTEVTNNLKITAKFGDVDIKLCVTEESYYKVITVCPASNGDDNVNKWTYLINGDNYFLNITEVTYGKFDYPVELIGGSTDGSSASVDLDKAKIEPDKLTLVAGEEGSATMTLYSVDGKRWNYWYPSIGETIKIKFTKDEQYCTSSVVRGDKPGVYKITVSCTKKTDSNVFKAVVDGVEISEKVDLEILAGNSYTLEVVDKSKFTVSNNEKTYTFKENPTNDQSVSWEFKLKDKYDNYITKSDLSSSKTTVKSELYGSDTSVYESKYDTSKGYYKFDDKITKTGSKITWYIICEESQNKYTFTYTKVAGEVDDSQSSYTVDKTVYIVKETSYVEVTLKDKYGFNVGETEGRLEKEKGNVVVQTKGKDTVNYVFDSVTNSNTLKYKYTYTTVGDFDVSVTYNKETVKPDTTKVTVVYQEISGDKSKLYINKGDSSNTENVMTTSSKTTVNNTVEYPYYKYVLYTEKGEKITNYDKTIEASSKMTFGDNTWDLKTTKYDDYIKFEYTISKDEFAHLPTGEYTLVVTVKNETKEYKVYLLGEKGSEGNSPSPNYDIKKTEVVKSRIEGVVGNTYSFYVQLKAADGLNWNYLTSANKISVSNSYGLASKQLQINKVASNEKGKFTIEFIQYVVSSETNPNVLTLSYDGNTIPVEVEVIMRHGKLAELIYVDGLRDGTVEDLPVLRFVPVDTYNNTFTDLFDSSKYSTEELQKLTNGGATGGITLTSNNYLTEGKYLNVQYITTAPTTISVTSDYFKETYKYDITAGKVDADKTYAELVQKENSVAGEEQTIVIYPKDANGNTIDFLPVEEKEKFVVKYTTEEKQVIDISKYCKIVDKIQSTAPTTDGNGKEFNKIQCTAVITISGETEFHVEYVDDTVECKQCTVDINPNEIDFSKTTSTYKNTNTNMSTTVATDVSAQSLPTFVLDFYDKYWNKVTDESKIKKLEVTTELTKADVELCVSDNGASKNSNVCSSDNSNVNKWYYLVNGDTYKLVVSKKDETVSFPVEIVNGATDGSSDKIDIDKTYIEPTKLTLVAGTEGTVSLELRTTSEERKNYFFEKPDESIKVKFEKDSDTCSYSVVQGTQPGQYTIKVKCTKKEDSNKVTISIDGKEVSQKVDLKIIPGSPDHSKLYTLDNKEITKSDLGEVKVTEALQIKEVLYDKYDNLITEINFSTDELGIVFGPVVEVRVGTTYNHNEIPQTNGEVIIELQSTLAGKHKVIGTYFPLDAYYVTFVHGDASEKSILEVDKTNITAGEKVNAYIIPYDKYGNLIDASIYKDDNPYKVSYKTETSNVNVYVEKYEIKKVGNYTVVNYEITLTEAGETTITGKVNDTHLNDRVVKVNPADMDFLHSKVYRYEVTVNAFETLRNGTIEKNNETEPIYRLYPYDQYDNAIEYIPEEKLKKLESYLNSDKERSVFYNFKLNNEKYTEQQYAEFVVDDDNNKNDYKNLVGGYYDLVFTDKSEKLLYNITLGNSKEGSNEEADIQKTHVTPEKIQITAGETGELFVEIRTANNVIKNSWDGFTIKVESCDSSDKTFQFEQETAGRLGTFLITLTTEKANTFPTLTECKLKVYVNNELVKDASPLLEVSPAAPYTSEILEKYWKDSSSSKVLKDGTADSNYVFEVRSYDKYGNLCETKQDIVGITTSLLGNEIKTTTSFTESETGYRKFTVPTSGAGVYTITSSINTESNKQYLPNDSQFTIYAGEIDLSKVIVKERETVIKAGEKAEIAILAYDKNGNSISPEDFKDKFTVVFNDAKNEKHETTNAADNDYKQVIYTSDAITVIGYVKVYVTYNVNNKSIDTSHISILVVSAEPDATNSVLSRLTSSGTITTYKNGDTISCNVKNPPVFNITLYDKYNNYISTIPSDVSVVEPVISGNDMTEITFNVENKNSYFDLNFNTNSNSVKVYTRLVKGKYDFTYDVKTSTGSSSFKYVIDLDADNDENHGNGGVEKLLITPSEATMYAGDNSYFTLELRTKKDLLYNDEVDTSAIKVVLGKEEKSFSYTVSATKDLGIYTISIYCEKKGKYTYVANVLEKTSNTVTFTVLPQLIPYPPYTQILTKPAEEITYDTKIEITYKLADKFNNLFEDRGDLVDGSFKYAGAELYVINNNQTVSKATQELLSDGETYKTTFDPIWPPLTMVINTVFHDDSHNFNVFPEDIVTKIKTVLEYQYTNVESTNAITIYVGEILDMRLYLFDNLRLCLEEGDYSENFEVVVNGPLNSVHNHEKVYKVHKVKNEEKDGCQNKYEIITTQDDIYTKTGQYHIDVYGGKDIIKSYNQTCLTTGYDKTGFTFEYLEENFNDSAIVVGDTVNFKITGHDKYGNLVNEPLKDDLNVYLTSKEGKTVKYELDSVEYVNGEVTYRCTVYTTGHLPVNLEYKEEKVTKVNGDEDLPTWLVHNGPCYAYDNEHFDLSNFTDNKITLARKNTFKFKCYDYYNNSIDYGGEIFHADCNYVYNSRQSSIDATVEDEGTGYYYVTFIPTNYGKHVINLQIERKNNGQEKYGEEIVLNLDKYECPDGKILCPNSNECVNNLVSCIYPPNDCPQDTPFECKVNGKTTCVASQTDCDCPTGYIRCDYMHYCVPENRPDMCATTRYTKAQCKRINALYTLFADGKCRNKATGQTPNQKVCPIGKVLCADLSCRDNYDLCLVSAYCPDGESRCPDQTCQFYTENCPNTITCEKSTDYVCNNDKCVESELECETAAVCDLDPFTNLCDGNQCASSWEDCPKKVSCGHGQSLCSDNVCRETCP